MADKSVLDKFYEKEVIDDYEYKKWSLFNKIIFSELGRDCKFIIIKKCLEDSRDNGWYKTHSGFINVNDFKIDNKKVFNSICKNLNKDNIYIFDEKNIFNINKLPNSIIYSDGKNAFVVRTNIERRDKLDRLLNCVGDEKIAESLYKYFNNVFQGRDYTIEK